MDWDYEENGELNPEFISYASNHKVHWKCHKCGYKWSATIYSRYNGNGCRSCAGQVLNVGKNDLLSQKPDLAKEWDYDKNYPLTPDQITVSNGKKVGWICSTCGYKWDATVDHRNRGRGCPICAKSRTVSNRLDTMRKKVGSLVDNRPNLVKEWNYEKNKPLIPENFTCGSGKKVWWTCSKCGHEWESVIKNRANKGSGCPKCCIRGPK